MYEPVGNSKLKYTETHFPIMPVINGYADNEEEIEIIAVLSDYEFARKNYETFKHELNELINNKNLKLCNDSITVVDIPYDNTVENQLLTFSKLIDCIEKDDIIYACITYGNKPVPIVELLVLSYAQQMRLNAHIDCIVYGDLDRTVDPVRFRIFDVTALVYLNDILHTVSYMQLDNPTEQIRKILSL